ncbi:MAG: lysine exporter LysO family protein [Lachnospiraceae bacterium]|nr:lysine exporter LysO family protein [Lachnospiraceae bacterium]
MSLLIVITLTAGVFAGFFVPVEYKAIIDQLSGWILYLLIFYVGIDMGLNRDIFGKIKNMGIKILLVPFGALIGSFLGGIITSFLVSETVKESLSVTMGMGWYSFSGILISDAGNPELGALAFLTNVFREIFAFIFIPFIARNIGFYSAVATGGATAMDTTLGVISRNTNGKIAVVSFISGMVITMCVPIIMPLFV